VASTGATEPTNPEEWAGADAAGVAVVVGSSGRAVPGVVGGAVGGVVAVDEGPGAAVTWEWVWDSVIRAVLEHPASIPSKRSTVANATVRWGTVRWRPGRGTDAHHSRGRVRTVMVGVASLVVLVASCGSAGHVGVRPPVSSPTVLSTASTILTTVPTTVATTVPTTTTPTVPAPAPVKAATPAPATTAPRPAPPVPAAPLLVTHLVGVGSATQVIAVSASAYGQTTATFTAYQDDATGWRQVFGPWEADIGYAGSAPPGQKHEGDGRTPSGSFGFDFFFGVLGDPGVQFPYRPVTGRNIVWDDDPSSPLYNQWVDTDVANAGASPEPMDDTPAYDFGAVIAYNMSPTVPGAGSAIFLHVSDGAATVGCVSLPTSELLAVLRWLSPAAQPRIIMGTAATIAP